MSLTKIFVFILNIFHLIFTVSNRPCPIGAAVESAGECLPYNKPGHYCCYLSANIPKVSTCLQISKSLYSGLKKYSLGGIIYDIECKEEIDTNNPEYIMPGTPCGVIEPSTPDECHIYSKPTSSCCLFKHKSSSGCYNLGFKSVGKVSIYGMTLDC